MKGSKNLVKYLLTIAFLSLLLAGCSEEQSQDTKEAETNDSGQAVDTTNFEEAEKIVKSSCIGCHGADLSGDLGPNLRNLPLTKEQVVEVLIKGRKTMPPGTANGEEDAVAEYILSLE